MSNVFEKLTPDNAAMLLVDHQVGTMNKLIGAVGVGGSTRELDHSISAQAADLPSN